MKFILFFIIGSIVVMFADGLFFDHYNSRPSMAMMHMEMRPTLYADPAPPSLEEYFGRYRLYNTSESNPDLPMVPDVIEENGVKIKVYYMVTNNVLHEIRPGVKVPMISFNNQVPAPTLRMNEGDHVRVIMYNNATDPHTIHWHGIEELDSVNDGVPDIGQHWVKPGETFTYDFIAGPSGTHMYHCHVEAPHHITMGMFGALIVDPVINKTVKINDGAPFGDATMERILMFTEYDAKHKHVPLPGEMMAMGPDGTTPWLLPSPKFVMPFDPKLDEYMINGKSFPATAPIDVKEGDIIRLRLVNLGLNIHSIHIHGHHFTVTHRDGFKLASPMQVDTLLIGPGEKYDVWFKADNPGIWMIHDHAGMNAMAKGYDPAGVMTTVRYQGASSEAYDEFLQRAAVYAQTVKHADEDHGMLTPKGAVGMMDMEMDMESGMDH
jgi:FtsP/CotA-like multicopper oxidase with cupredoxin domain